MGFVCFWLFCSVDIFGAVLRQHFKYKPRNAKLDESEASLIHFKVEKVTWDAFNAMPVTSFVQSGVTSRLDVSPGQSALAPRTHRWEEFKKDCGKEDVAQTFPHDRTVGPEIPDLTLYRPPLVWITMSAQFKSGPAFGLSAEVKSKVGITLIDSCQIYAGSTCAKKLERLLYHLYLKTYRM